MAFTVINDDCAAAMKKMDDASVDAIVTDPPYGLAFMGAEWDSFGGSSGKETIDERRTKMNEYLGANAVVPAFASSHSRMPKLSEMHEFQEHMTPIFVDALRVAKPGAYLLCFGGTRTFHRMACAIENAGWEIRDCIMWVYGSGFPKSMDVAKAIDKASGYVGEVIGERTVDVGMQGGHMHAGRKQQQQQQQVRSLSQDAVKWDGWGTCLKPAWEPIIVARKPLDGTVVNNVLTWGVGAMNIDGCRIPTSDKLGGGMRAGGADGVWDRPFMHDETAQAAFVERKKANVAKSEELGRFPANLAHDGSEEVVRLFPDTGVSSGGGGVKAPGKNGIYGSFNGHEYPKELGMGDSGSAARFFYCAKASKSDRGEGNDHPTVKPTALMEWLVRLVCRQGGVVLDPFCGSGTTGVACVREGMDFIGIERDDRYAELARGRIADAEPTQARLF